MADVAGEGGGGGGVRSARARSVIAAQPRPWHLITLPTPGQRQPRGPRSRAIQLSCSAEQAVDVVYISLKPLPPSYSLLGHTDRLQTPRTTLNFRRIL